MKGGKEREGHEVVLWEHGRVKGMGKCSGISSSMKGPLRIRSCTLKVRLAQCVFSCVFAGTKWGQHGI